MDIKENNIMLIGFMGSGKTTVSHELSRRMQIPEVDMDAYIVRHEGKSISDIFAESGEDVFREIETACLKEIQKATGRIVSCGGGAVLRDENVECMKRNGVIVLLTAEPETIYKRVRYSTDRPILNGHMNVGYIKELMEKRKPRYMEVADIVIETDRKDISAVAGEIILKIGKFEKK